MHGTLKPATGDREPTHAAHGGSNASLGRGEPPGRGEDFAAQSARLAPVQQRKGPVQQLAGADASAQVHAAAAHGISGAGGRLPHVDKIQKSFGTYDVSNVSAHTDSAASEGSAEMGAEAYATGSDVAFAGAPDLHTAAHEAAHVVQQRAGVSLPGGVGAAGDRYEQHADSVADAVVAGRSAEPMLAQMASPEGANSPAAVQRRAVQRVETLSGNPQPWTQNGAAVTTHRAPTLADSANRPTPGAASGSEDRQLRVRVVAEAGRPVHSEPPATPASNALYAETADETAAGYTPVTGFDGTLAAPQVEQVANNDLFIDGRPTSNDVQQASIGDCYFLATLMSVADRDPGRLLSMFTPDGQGGATVKLWRATAHEPSLWERIFGTPPERDWHQVDVRVTNELQFGITSGRIFGAQLRCAERPKSADHWSALEGDRLAIHARETYQCARWAPLLEKAYARFSEPHDQYGGARPGGKGGGQGYNNINGGWSQHAMCVLYGPEADARSADLHQTSTQWAPGGDVVASNQAVMEQLVLLQGRGASASPGDPSAPIVTATSMVHLLIPRLAAAIPAAQADPDYVNVDAARQAAVVQVLTSINAWQALPADAAPPAPQPKATARTAIGTACVEAMRPGYDESTENRAVIQRFRHGTGPIAFDNGSTEVKDPGRARLTQLNTDLATFVNPQVRVDIDGYASKTGPSAHNQELSEQRADAVTELIEGPRVIAPHTSLTIAHGDVGASPDPSWRRVDVAIVPTGYDQNSLLSDARSPAIRAAADLMLDLRNIGTDSSSGQRNIYGDHVYSVSGVELVTGDGTTVPLSTVPAAMRPMLYPLVNPDRSTVRLRNPHHGNEPDRHNNDTPTRPGDGAPTTRYGNTSDGLFTMTLNEFFRNFTSVESGVFPRS